MRVAHAKYKTVEFTGRALFLHDVSVLRDWTIAPALVSPPLLTRYSLLDCDSIDMVPASLTCT